MVDPKHYLKMKPTVKRAPKSLPKQHIPANARRLIVKVTVPRIVTDNPMVKFASRDGKFEQEVPVNQTIVRWMAGKNEAYFELVMNSISILSMQPTTEEKYYASPGPDVKEVQP